MVKLFCLIGNIDEVVAGVRSGVDDTICRAHSIVTDNF
jgi:hypothetical protein